MQISFAFAVTAKLISTFVFATQIVSTIPLLLKSEPKFPASSHLLCWYSSEIWGALNPSSPRLRNNVSMDKIYKDIEPDKLNTKFCNLVLGVNRKSSNFAVFAELGRHPFYLDIVKNVLLFLAQG